MMTSERSATGHEDAEVYAATLINDAVEEKAHAGSSMENFGGSLVESTKEAPTDVQRLVFTYVASFQGKTHGAVVDILPEGVGGQFDGSGISIAAANLEVGSEGVSKAAERIAETTRHEAYHKFHNHTEEFVVGPGATMEAIVTIGGVRFSETALIEGVTVDETGDKFVSEKYVGFKRMIHEAIAGSRITKGELLRAVNVTKNLSEIDDSAHRPVLAI